ncbi:DoxX family protein [Bacillus solimangrovi]|uniref:Crp/Fnr family transcriptional regulator n=1 Tax=Bacillus solimangrovi TaxID=1305675 RepID=A0A1E5LBB6_9BACI|nr:DoxX family protein [Bacillus solimangrovi]OEH91382.1 Crp/Fnr family transcriptional regulator [Bacillus solimangrovi]
MKWIKSDKIAVIWTILRVWLGVQWIEAGWSKVTGGFDAGGFLKGAIAKASGDHPAVQGWYAGFLENFALPNVELFNVIIPWAEFLAGIGLILGALTLPALIGAAFMNLNFMLAGTTSTNPVLYTVAFILILVGPTAYYYGLDRFLIPFTKDRMRKRKHDFKDKGHQAHAH